MKNRRVPILRITSDPEKMDIKEVEKIKNLKELTFQELGEAIIYANTYNQNSASLFEINQSGDVIELERNSFVPALEEAIKHFEKKENYEKCAYYKNLIIQTNEQERKDFTSSEQYSKRENPDSQKVKTKTRHRKKDIHRDNKKLGGSTKS